MSIQLVGLGRMRRGSLLLAVWLWASPALGIVPDAMIEELVQLKIRTHEMRLLSYYHMIDHAEWAARKKAIDAGTNDLNRQLRRFPRDEQRQAQSRVEGLARAQLSTLEPQWRARGEAFKRAQAQDDRDTRADIAADAKTASEAQRRRLQLEERRAKGEISAGDFAAQDRQALDDIMALRRKYEAQPGYAAAFDGQLERATRSLPADGNAVRTGPSKPPPPKAATSQPPLSQTRLGVPPGAPLPPIPPSVVPLGVRLINAAYGIAAMLVLYSLRRWVRPTGPGRPSVWLGRLGYIPLILLVGLWMAPSDYQPNATYLANEFANYAFGAIGILGVIHLIARSIGPKPASRASTVHGSAHYAPMQLDVEDDTCLHRGVFLGKSSAPEMRGAPFDAAGAPLCTRPEHHTLIVARTRTGKGTRVIVPTLLRYTGSALVIDPKGENAAITGRARDQDLGQSIHVLNPWNELSATFITKGFSAATYNPLDILDRNDPNAVAIAQTLAGAICPASPAAKDRFWQGSAASVLAAVFLWLADRPDEQKTLARAREIVSLTRKQLKEQFLIPMAASEGFGGAIRELAAPFIDLADETYSGIMSSLAENTKFLSDPQIKAATAASTFNMDDLATGKTTVYVVIPTERMDTQKTWLRLVISAAMHIFKNRQGKLASGHRCLFLIDEFAALGRLDDLPRDIATMSGFGVDFALIVQGLDQLKDHYGDAKGTILSNCAYKWFCNVNDLESAKYVSETLGKATVGTTSTSDSSSSGSSSSSHSHSTTHGETGRALLTPDEVLNLGKDVAIAIQPDGHPHYLRPVDYWNLMEAFINLFESRPRLYWDPFVRYGENPYFTPSPPTGGDKRSQGRGSGHDGNGGQETPPRHKSGLTEAAAREIRGVQPDASGTESRPHTGR